MINRVLSLLGLLKVKHLKEGNIVSLDNIPHRVCFTRKGVVFKNTETNTNKFLEDLNPSTKIKLVAHK